MLEAAGRAAYALARSVTKGKDGPMKAILVMFDSLNRRMLSPYGCSWTHTPNFARLAERTATFDTAYVGSMPCMPARREIHTGRCNFLHRSWGPLEPFDDSMPELLRRAGIYTHLVTDHYHYWEDGGATYHNRYSTYDFSRGQEGDLWKPQVRDPEVPECVSPRSGPMWRQDWVNRQHIRAPEDYPQHKTFAGGLDFLRTNAGEDNWFLHIETFDPHEPYYSAERYKKLYPHGYTGRHFDWPPYARVRETPEEVAHCRYENAALHSMCDDYLGRVLNLMDEQDLWKDTMLIVNTDHGFLLGEHGWWAKCAMPFYNEVAHMPLFVWDPRCRVRGERRRSLVQTIDLPATLLEFFGVERPADMQGMPLRETVARDTAVRPAGLFGMFGAQVNVTDGRYVYMRGIADRRGGHLYQYTHMPTHMRGFFSPDEMRTMTIGGPFGFTKGCPVMRIGPTDRPFPADRELPESQRTFLFDLETDPGQEHPIADPAVEDRMIGLMMTLLRENEAPPEQFERLGLPGRLCGRAV